MLRQIAIAISLIIAPAGAAEHWAYQASVAGIVEKAANPVDAILRESWATAGLQPATMALPEQWLERAACTLTGLPASPEQRRRISEDSEAWSTLIDELLASPGYGERWARHWMDVARYAETRGYDFARDNRYPYAYTYRDWLIRSFNGDRPYNEFVKLQIAADLIVAPDHPDLAALGMLTVGGRQGHVETIDDRGDVITRGFLSSTVSCARCRAHKTDPITMRDYYSVFSILENTVEHQPMICSASDAKAFAEFKRKKEELEGKDRAVRHGIVGDMRSSRALAGEWIKALATGGPLGEFARRRICPLSCDADRIHELYNQEDGNKKRQRDSAMAKLETEHPGAPPRAMAVWFMENGWSVKELHRLPLSSEAFRIAADGPPANDTIDEANTHFWKWQLRRMDFESMRDHMLATAGSQPSW